MSEVVESSAAPAPTPRRWLGLPTRYWIIWSIPVAGSLIASIVLTIMFGVSAATWLFLGIAVVMVGIRSLVVWAILRARQG